MNKGIGSKALRSNRMTVSPTRDRRMKTKTRTSMFVSFVILAASCLSQDMSKPTWRGRVESENGIPVVKNPADPVFGTQATFPRPES
jgi:hypothetical protein